MLKERFQEEQCEKDWRILIKEVLTREEDMAELKALKDYPSRRRVVSQDVRWDLVQMRRAGGSPKKVKGSA